MIALTNQMTQLNPDDRPTMAEVQREVAAIEAAFKHQQAQNQKYLHALEKVPFKENKMENRFLAQGAIREFNRQQEQEWRRMPTNARGDKPIALAIPENTDLDNMISEIKQYQKAQQEEANQQIASLNPAQQAPSKDMKTEENREQPILKEKSQKWIVGQKGEKRQTEALLFSHHQSKAQQAREDEASKMMNNVINGIVKEIKNTIAKQEKQSSGFFTPLSLTFSGNQKEPVSLGRELIKKLESLVKSDEMPYVKLNELKKELNEMLLKMNNTSNGKKCNFYKVCESAKDALAKSEQQHSNNKIKR